MTDNHPLIPPPELMQQVQEWLNKDRTPRSPAAQAVLDALCVDELNGSQQLLARAYAAAALRAAANAVSITPYTVEHAQFWSELLAIADELEGYE